jgi:hypothetical protein
MRKIEGRPGTYGTYNIIFNNTEQQQRDVDDGDHHRDDEERPPSYRQQFIFYTLLNTCSYGNICRHVF